MSSRSRTRRSHRAGTKKTRFARDLVRLVALSHRALRARLEASQMNRTTDTTLTVCTGNKLTRADIGCWADGGFGHPHVREVLAVVLTDKGGPSDLAVSLLGEMSDDGAEEYEAIDWLNEHAVEEGLHFTLCDGDLLLVEEGFDE